MERQTFLDSRKNVAIAHRLATATLSLLLTLLGTTVHAQTTYTFTDIGAISIPPDSASYHRATFAAGINNAGQIAGEVIYTDGTRRPFRITPAVVAGQKVWFQDNNHDGINDLMQVLPLPSGYFLSNFNLPPQGCINASGQVCATILNGNTQRAAIWSSNAAGTITVFGNTTTYPAQGINDLGDVATGLSQATLWEWVNNKYVSVAFGPTGINTLCRDVNNARQVIGRWQNGSNLGGFVWSPTDGFVDIGGLTGCTYPDLTAINESSKVVGSTNVLGTGSRHLLMWTPGATDGDPNNPQMKDLGTLYTNSYPYGTNNIDAPQIVGASSPASDGASHAFVWQSGTYLDLHYSVTNLPAGYTLTEARGINDLGQIIATYTYLPSGRTKLVTRSCILTPNP